VSESTRRHIKTVEKASERVSSWRSWKCYITFSWDSDEKSYSENEITKRWWSRAQPVSHSTKGKKRQSKTALLAARSSGGYHSPARVPCAAHGSPLPLSPAYPVGARLPSLACPIRLPYYHIVHMAAYTDQSVGLLSALLSYT
jgi:hypothetical protein